MKKLILISAISILLLKNLFAQWEVLNEGVKGWISSVDFVNNTGWIAGQNGEILKTLDGGESWTPIAVDENWQINQIDFIDDSIGWAAGTSSNYGIIINTNNGGNKWLVQKQIADVWLNSIYIIDEKNIYSVGNKIYKTTNGGLNWVDVSPNIKDGSYNSLWFRNPECGVIIGNYCDSLKCKGIILRTTNGGNNWEHSILNEFYDISDLQFWDDSTGYFIGHSDTVSFFCKTEDMLKTWTVITQSSDDISSFQFLDNSTVYAAMNNWRFENSVKKSSDGGITWHNIQSFDFTISKIYFNPAKECFLLSNLLAGGRGYPIYSIIYKSRNEYSDWEIKKFTYPVFDIYFINKDKGFLFGGSNCVHCPGRGDIFSTIDAGKTWKMKFNIKGFNEFGIFKSCVFINEYFGYCTAQGPTSSSVYRTTDQGDNWKKIYEFNPDSTGYFFKANDIFFKDEEIGWIVGNFYEGAGVLHTTDGGNHWNKEWSDLSFSDLSLNSICFNDTIGWTAGNLGKIVKYITQNKQWVKIPSETDIPLNKVFSIDDNVWIAGGYSNDQNFFAVFLKSTNNGQTWTQRQTNPYLINDIYFIDNNLGWAVGTDMFSKGVILKSTNGGDTWETAVDNLLGPLNSIFIRDIYGWAAGEFGLVLRTTNAGTTWINEQNKIYPVQFRLEQNFPNPFNPSTSIQYAVGSPANGTGRQFVSVKVYDVLGREISTLVNKEKKAGNYEVEFEGSKLSSGVYFYRLSAGKFSAVKKMLLIK